MVLHIILQKSRKSRICDELELSGILVTLRLCGNCEMAAHHVTAHDGPSRRHEGRAFDRQYGSQRFDPHADY
ncbi:hypothetical protein RRG08_019276 [Elysia crispata]|uniref:Uncharacterized protein n=1 Tax=Elysia crispata TaxID=231223 RepID=A0AAE0XMV4_9GAST|nr:hypothetical protein RRG08_019276 [Elysia crispata]